MRQQSCDTPAVRRGSVARALPVLLRQLLPRDQSVTLELDECKQRLAGWGFVLSAYLGLQSVEGQIAEAEQRSQNSLVNRFQFDRP